MNNKIAVLKISSWIGTSFDAEHFYGKIHYYKNEEYEQIELLRKLTSSKEIKYLNKKEGWISFDYKIGDEYRGFISSEQVRKTAIEYVKNNLVSIEVLLEGDFGIGSVQKCIYAKDEKIKEKINKLYEKANKLNFYDNKKNWNKMEIIDNKFSEIINL